MKANNLLRITSIFFAVSIIGCTQMETGDSTTVGAATGGVVGAGLGAVVGNQVGNTTEGLAIGAIAGAGTGAAIGSVFDRQQDSMRNQDEAIERQERIITAQQNELQELRKLGQDSVSFKDERTSAALPSSTKFEFPSAPRARVARNSVGTSQMPVAGVVPSLPTAARMPTERAVQPVRVQRTAPPVQERSLAVSTNNNAPARDMNTDTGSQGGNDVVRGSYGWDSNSNSGMGVMPTQPKPARREVATSSYDSTPSNPAQVAHPVIVDRGMPAPPQAQALSLNTPECVKADNEAKSALTARDPADKLFHYRRALRLCPDNANFHNGLGEVYIALNRSEDARYEFNEALRLNPSLGAARSNLTRVQ